MHSHLGELCCCLGRILLYALAFPTKHCINALNPCHTCIECMIRMLHFNSKVGYIIAAINALIHFK